MLHWEAFAMTGKEKIATVIARSAAPKGQVTWQSAKTGLPQESLVVQIASLKDVRNDRERKEGPPSLRGTQPQRGK